MPKTTLNRLSVQGGRFSSPFWFLVILNSSYVVCPNMAKNNSSNANKGLITTEDTHIIHHQFKPSITESLKSKMSQRAKQRVDNTARIHRIYRTLLLWKKRQRSSLAADCGKITKTKQQASCHAINIH